MKTALKLRAILDGTLVVTLSSNQDIIQGGEIPFVLPVFLSVTEMEWNIVGKKIFLSSDILIS